MEYKQETIQKALIKNDGKEMYLLGIHNELFHFIVIDGEEPNIMCYIEDSLERFQTYEAKIKDPNYTLYTRFPYMAAYINYKISYDDKYQYVLFDSWNYGDSYFLNLNEIFYNKENKKFAASERIAFQRGNKFTYLSDVPVFFSYGKKHRLSSGEFPMIMIGVTNTPELDKTVIAFFYEMGLTTKIAYVNYEDQYSYPAPAIFFKDEKRTPAIRPGIICMETDIYKNLNLMEFGKPENAAVYFSDHELNVPFSEDRAIYKLFTSSNGKYIYLVDPSI